MSIKLRLDYFLMRGGLFELGDNVGGVDITMHLKTWNSSEVSGADLSMEVRSFALRKNDGSQPVPDDFPVIAGDGWKVFAKHINWASKPTWKPYLEKLIEQQIKYDKQQEQPIEELMINAKGNNMPVYTQEMKEAGKAAPIGSKVQIVNTSSFDLEYGDDILGLEVTVKSDPISVGKDNIVQVVEYASIAYCFETDMIFPFKSQEEIEMEDAKAKQVGDLYEKYEYYRHFVAHGNLTGFIRLMQENGDLAEIILPLESN